VSHHSFSKAAVESSKRRGKTYESPNPNRIQTNARTATVPVVRGTGTSKGWPPHIRKSSGLKGHDSRPASLAISDQTMFTLPDKEVEGDKQQLRQSARHKVDGPASKPKENR
jgi:hypothetical protein